jgi:hypothetical protein
LQMRVDAAEAAFPPSEGPGDWQTQAFPFWHSSCPESRRRFGPSSMPSPVATYAGAIGRGHERSADERVVGPMADG